MSSYRILSLQVRRRALTTLPVAVWIVLALTHIAHGQLQVFIANNAPTNFQLGWTELGTTNAYTVQYRDNLADHPWLTAPHTAPWPMTSTAWVDPRTDPVPQRFYRVIGVELPQRGRLLSSTARGSYSRIELTFIFWLAGVPLTPQYGVDMVRLRYETVNPIGGKAIASGLLVLPQSLTTNLPLVCYQHGTLTRTNDAPSVTQSLDSEAMVAIVMASCGYVTVIADYLGLGESPPLHPYHHAWTEATACVDMLRATRAYCTNHGRALNGKLFLAGYSQGGHATMALHRELETYHADEFSVTASAPMAGAYDLSGITLDDFLSDRPKPTPYYYAYLLAAYIQVYQLAPSLAEILAPPYDTTLPPLLRGNATGDEINAVMPADPRQMLKPEYLTALQQRPDHPFRITLRANDVYAWKPRAPMRLYHCGGDQDVPIANSHFATNVMVSLGATNVALVIPSATYDHRACAMPSLLAAKTWFDSLK